jgi:hypothetical protein
MIRRLPLTLALSLIALPTFAAAQRARTQSDKRTELFDKPDFPKGPSLRVRDIEDMSPLKLLIDKRKDLKLTDAQIVSFKDAEGTLKEQNAPLYKSVDSLLRDMRGSGMAPADRAKIMNARNGMFGVIDEIKVNYDAAAKEAVATLDAEQQTKANELIAKQREDGDKNVRQRLSAGGDRRDGQPPQL